MGLQTGTFISDEMVEYISQWTRPYEFKQIAKSHNSSDEFARKLAKGERRITKNNIGLITDILKLAISNRNKRLARTEKTHKKLKKDGIDFD